MMSEPKQHESETPDEIDQIILHLVESGPVTQSGVVRACRLSGKPQHTNASVNSVLSRMVRAGELERVGHLLPARYARPSQDAAPPARRAGSYVHGAAMPEPPRVRDPVRGQHLTASAFFADKEPLPTENERIAGGGRSR
jgi:hypothetical protein